MRSPDNKKTTQVCRFISQYGLPTIATPQSLESVALGWVNDVRSNKNDIHASDMDIINQFGLNQIIFHNQPEPSVIAALKSQIENLQQMVVNLSSGLTPQISKPQECVETIKVQSKSAKMRTNNLTMYQENREKYHNIILAHIKSSPNGVTKRELHRVTENCFSGAVLTFILDFLLSKQLVFWELVGDGKRRHRVYKSVSY